MWVLSEVREKVCDFQKLPLDKSHFITEVDNYFIYRPPTPPYVRLSNESIFIMIVQTPDTYAVTFHLIFQI